MKNNSNVLLRQIIKATLSERRLQPVAAEKLVKKLKSEITRIVNEPDIKKMWLRKISSHLGRNEPEILEKIYQGHVAQLDDAINISTAKKWISINTEFYTVDEDLMQVLAIRIEKMVRDAAGNYGWTILSTNHDLKKRFGLHFVLEPNFGDILQKTEVPNFLYHITSVFNVEKILKKGILPKKNSHVSKQDQFENNLWDDETEKEKFPFPTGRQYAPRVYLTNSKQLGYELALSFQPAEYVEAMVMGHNGGFEQHILLRIDTKKILPGTKFYIDYEIANERYPAGTAFWTYSRIPANAVSVDPDDAQEYAEFLKRIQEPDDLDDFNR
jgi:hypothetical protein